MLTVMDAISQGLAAQRISSGLGATGMGTTPSLFLGTALDTLSGAGLESLIEGNNTSADELAAQMLGSIIGAEIAKPAVKAIKEYKAGQAELAAERKAQLQMEVPSVELGSPDLTTNQLTNYYNQNQDQYMTGGNTPSSAAANSTSQSSLNSGASGPIGVTGSWNTPSTPTRVSAGSSSGFWSGVALLGKELFTGSLETSPALASQQAPEFANDMNMHYQNSISLMQEIQGVDIQVALNPLADMENLAGLKQGLVQDLNTELQMAQASENILNNLVLGGNLSYVMPGVAIGFGILEYEENPTMQNLMMIDGGIAGGGLGATASERILFGSEADGLITADSLSNPYTAIAAVGIGLSLTALGTFSFRDGANLLYQAGTAVDQYLPGGTQWPKPLFSN